MTTALVGGEGSASLPVCSLPLGKTWYPLYRTLGGPQGRAGQVQKILPPTGIRSMDRPGHSQLLYRLSYPAHKSLPISWGGRRRRMRKRRKRRRRTSRRSHSSEKTHRRDLQRVCPLLYNICCQFFKLFMSLPTNTWVDP